MEGQSGEMHSSLLLVVDERNFVGKRPDPAVASAATAADSSRRIFIADKKSKISFLIDTGAEVSVLPASKGDRLHESATTLTAANRSTIKTFGTRVLDVDLGLHREFKHPFIIADVSTAIIGADFLASFHLLVDLRHRRLVDDNTGLTTSQLSLINTCRRREPLSSDDDISERRRRRGKIEVLESLQISFDGVDPRVKLLLKKYPDILRPHFTPKDVKHSVVHHIKTTGPPVHARPRRLPPHKLKAAKKEFEHMVSSGIAKRANSPWSSAITVVPKKPDTWRPCGDYRPLNAVTLPDKYPIPNIQDFNQSIGENKVFGTIDLIRAYHQIPVSPDDVNKTAVTTPFGNFVFLAMPFGLRNAAQTFQRFMDEVVQGLDFVYVYIDDILIASKNADEHIRNLDVLFERLHRYGITINTTKSNFIDESVDFLGFRVTADGISPLPSKVEAITEFARPSNVKGLLRFLGMVNFYRPCLRRAADVMDPLYDLTADCRTKTGRFKNKDIVWTDTALAAFDATKTCPRRRSHSVAPSP